MFSNSIEPIRVHIVHGKPIEQRSGDSVSFVTSFTSDPEAFKLRNSFPDVKVSSGSMKIIQNVDECGHV